MAEASWYVVHTYSGYENKVKANIEKTIENRHLEDQILEVRVPMQDVVEMKNGARKQVQKKMFPGYVLINMIMNDDTWYVVRNTRGVTGFVGPGSKPVPLTERERTILKIDEATERAGNVLKGPGCPNCKGGYRGRIGIFEIFQVGEEARRLIYEKLPASVLRAKARELGMRTLREDGIRKVLAGLTSADEVIQTTVTELEQ